MAVLKFKDIDKLSERERQEKLKELGMELIKNKASSQSKTNVREIKRAIARLLTFNRLNKKSVENQGK